MVRFPLADVVAYALPVSTTANYGSNFCRLIQWWTCTYWVCKGWRPLYQRMHPGACLPRILVHKHPYMLHLVLKLFTWIWLEFGLHSNAMTNLYGWAGGDVSYIIVPDRNPPQEQLKVWFNCEIHTVGYMVSGSAASHSAGSVHPWRALCAGWIHVELGVENC